MQNNQIQKGRVIKLEKSFSLEVFKKYPLGSEWIVLKGGKNIIVAPLHQDSGANEKDAVDVTPELFDQHFTKTERREKTTNSKFKLHCLAYQWNDAIRSGEIL